VPQSIGPPERGASAHKGDTDVLIGSSITPFYQNEPTSYTTLAPTLTPYGGSTSGALAGGGVSYFTGYGSNLPYNPTTPVNPAMNFYAQNFSNVALGGLFSPNSNVPNYPIANASTGAASIPATTTATPAQPAAAPVAATGSDQVVYAHYAPTTAPATTTTAGGETKPAADPKKADGKKKADAKKSDDAKKAEPKKEEPKKAETVKVKSGDSLSKIAAAHGTTWQKLYELNKGAIGGDPNLIHAGLELKLP
jgi:LysM repeat protein